MELDLVNQMLPFHPHSHLQSRVPPRRAHVMFHHLISGEMLDGCVRPLAILHNSVFSTYSALWCSVVSGTIRTVVVSVTVMGSWEPGLSRSPPKPTDSSAWTRTKQEGNQTNDFWWKIQLASGKSTLRSKYDGVLSKWSIETQKEHKRNKMNGFYISFMMFQLSVRISGFLI